MVWFLRGICKQCISRLYVYVIFKLSNPPFMDKQNEGIEDPAIKEIPYDMGG